MDLSLVALRFDLFDRVFKEIGLMSAVAYV